MNDVYQVGTHITFRPAPTKHGAKTYRWFVQSKYDDCPVLADIAWFGRWRKYAMYPREGTVFEEICLRDIADFCEGRTKAHREAKKGKRNERETRV